MRDNATCLWGEGINKERKVDSGERGDNCRHRSLKWAKRRGIRVQGKDSPFTVTEGEVEDTGIDAKVQIDLAVMT